MKISNATQIRFLAYLVLTSAILTLTSLLFQENLIIQGIHLLFFTVLSYVFINLRSTFIEFSGSCLAIKKIHPLSTKKFIKPVLELPVSSLSEFSILENMLSDCIKIKMRSSGNAKTFRFHLFFFSKKQIVSFKNSIHLIRQ